MHNYHIILSYIIDINKIDIEIHNNKYVKLLGQDFTNISLKACRYIEYTKIYHLILEITVLGHKNRFLFIVFLDSLLIKSACEIKLGKLLGLA